MSKTEVWKELYRYWLSKHVDGRPPGREDIDPPSDILHLVRHLILMEVLPEGYVYRLMGTTAAGDFGLDMTGRLVGAGIGTDSVRSSWIAAVDFVARHQKPKLLEAKFPPGLTTRNVLLLLPLVGRDGNTEQILAGSFSDRDYHFPLNGILMIDREIAL
jgi:hypothetical protein